MVIAMSDQQQAEYMTAEQAAAAAGVARITVDRAVRAGKLAYRGRRGAVKLLSRADVAAWIASRGQVEPITTSEQGDTSEHAD